MTESNLLVRVPQWLAEQAVKDGIADRVATSSRSAMHETIQIALVAKDVASTVIVVKNGISTFQAILRLIKARNAPPEPIAVSVAADGDARTWMLDPASLSDEVIDEIVTALRNARTSPAND